MNSGPPLVVRNDTILYNYFQVLPFPDKNRDVFRCAKSCRVAGMHVTRASRGGT